MKSKIVEFEYRIVRKTREDGKVEYVPQRGRLTPTILGLHPPYWVVGNRFGISEVSTIGRLLFKLKSTTMIYDDMCRTEIVFKTIEEAQKIIEDDKAGFPKKVNETNYISAGSVSVLMYYPS